MTVLALVLAAAILLTVMVVHSYSREGAHTVRLRRPSRRAADTGAGWMFVGSDGGGSDCSAGDAGGSCGDGGGGGGGGGD